MKWLAAEEARSLGERVLEIIEPLVDRAEIAGSVRRNKDLVHDVDIVVIPKTLTWPAMVANKIRGELGGTVVKSGPKILQMNVLGRQVDLYAATEETWGVNLLRWTGSKEHNIKLCSRARRMGLKLAVSRGLEKDGEVIASRTEEELFEALGLPWIPPEERGV